MTTTIPEPSAISPFKDIEPMDDIRSIDRVSIHCFVTVGKVGTLLESNDCKSIGDFADRVRVFLRSQNVCEELSGPIPEDMIREARSALLNLDIGENGTIQFKVGDERLLHYIGINGSHHFATFEQIYQIDQ
ncbi:hypothetical protein KKF55_04765 [Patescibacteria group bacterium]|nr:hypothetical protein [Patescibacteria group bacterium]